MEARRRTLAAAEADLRVMMTEHDETEDIAANVEKLAVLKSTAVVKAKPSTQAGRGRPKETPERSVALHAPPQGKA